MNDMPKSGSEGWRRVCDERNYAFVGTDLYQRQISSSLSCQMVSLPGNSYPETLTYIISRTSHYKGLIHWRWVPYIMLWTIYEFAVLLNRSINVHAERIVLSEFNCSTEIQMFIGFETCVLLSVLKTNSKSISYWYW